MNPGDSKTAPLPPQHGDEPLPNQQEKAQLQKPTYPQSNSYTTQTVGGSILIGNPGSVLRGNQHRVGQTASNGPVGQGGRSRQRRAVPGQRRCRVRQWRLIAGRWWLYRPVVVEHASRRPRAARHPAERKYANTAASRITMSAVASTSQSASKRRIGQVPRRSCSVRSGNGRPARAGRAAPFLSHPSSDPGHR